MAGTKRQHRYICIKALANNNHGENNLKSSAGGRGQTVEGWNLGADEGVLEAYVKIHTPETWLKKEREVNHTQSSFSVAE